MNEMVTLWLVVLIVSIGVEVATLGLTSIWFAGGAVVAVIVAAFHGPVWLPVSYTHVTLPTNSRV